jgi:hypothetical protein
MITATYVELFDGDVTIATAGSWHFSVTCQLPVTSLRASTSTGYCIGTLLGNPNTHLLWVY